MQFASTFYKQRLECDPRNSRSRLRLSRVERQNYKFFSLRYNKNKALPTKGADVWNFYANCVFLTYFLLRVYNVMFEPEITTSETIKEKFPAVCVPEITFFFTNETITYINRGEPCNIAAVKIKTYSKQRKYIIYFKSFLH